MSDKSVRKVLDWPNHRVGSKPSDPIRFEEGEAFECPVCTFVTHDEDKFEKHIEDHWEQHTGPHDEEQKPQSTLCPDCGQDLAELASEDMDKHVLQHHPEWKEKWYGEQGDASTGQGWEGQGQNDLSQQLNPTTEQNVSPFTQSQFTPTSTQITAPTGKGEGDVDEYIFFDCPDCHFPWAMGPEEQADVLKKGKWDCGQCGYEYPVTDVEDFIELEFGPDDDEGEEFKEEASLWVEPCPSCEGSGVNEVSGRPCTYCRGKGKIPKYEEELKDPRIDKDKDKEKGADLSPEAQKIAGTDPASVEAKSQEKPKLEVDVSDKITILGKTGSGKTNLIKVLLSDILKDYQFVLLDALGNFSEYDGQPNVDYHQVSPADTAGVDEILYSALERGDCMIVMDEVDRYKTKPGTMLNELVNVGRNYNVGGIFAARRTADVDKDILANSPYIFTFQHILPQDLDVLIDWFAQPEEVFRDLQEFEAILFHNGEQMWVGKVPEKPTTKPTAKPTPPKKGKGKDKEKGKEPESEKGKEPSEPKEKRPPTPPSGEGMEPEKPPEEGPEEPTEEFKGEQGEIDCPYCEQHFASEASLENHISEDHADADPDSSAYAPKEEEGAFKCEFDGQSFKYEKDYLNHLNTHAGR